MKYLLEHWEYFMLLFYALEKAVKVTPWKWDDILFDIIFKTIKEQLTKKAVKNEPKK